MRHDGTIQEFLSSKNDPTNDLEWIEDKSTGYDHIARQLLFSMADTKMTDETFRHRLREFNRIVVAERKAWKKKLGI